MQNKTKNIIVTFGFSFILIIAFLGNLFIKDKEISIVERRKLAQFPEFSFEEISNDFENYAIDQFVLRDELRYIKSFFSMNIFMQKDSNKLFEKDNALYKMEYPLNENNVIKTTEKIKSVYNKYLNGMNVYYSIIPEKNYYLENDDHLKLDYNKLISIVADNLNQMKFIDISNYLTLDDYYRTDIHWKQENLTEVVKKLQTEMNLENVKTNYSKENVGLFYGTYYGQIASNISPDEMYILTNETTKNSITYNFETKQEGNVYDKTKTSDKYDIYVSGATPLITIDNPNAQNKKELLLFRDSFGSSLAPLLLENYSKITLIDLRYISSTFLGKYIEFDNQDVLFLYSTLVLNQNILR